MSSPYSPQLEKAPTAMKTQRSQKVTNFKKYLKKCATHYEPCQEALRKLSNSFVIHLGMILLKYELSMFQTFLPQRLNGRAFTSIFPTGSQNECRNRPQADMQNCSHQGTEPVKMTCDLLTVRVNTQECSQGCLQWYWGYLHLLNQQGAVRVSKMFGWARYTNTS